MVHKVGQDRAHNLETLVDQLDNMIIGKKCRNLIRIQRKHRDKHDERRR